VYWDAVVQELIRAGMFQQSDVYTVVEMVETYAMGRAYRQAHMVATHTDGILSDDAEKAFVRYKQAMELFNKMAAEHGMTPAARLRLGLGQIKAQTLLEALAELPD
jgi:phage terminase small subunit